MGENSKIEWTDHTWNPWIGCQKVSPGCDHCYAEAMMADRYGRVVWGPHGDRVRTSPAYWAKARKWNREAAGASDRPRVFCASLADVFDNHRSILPQWRADLWSLIRETPNLDWLLLTKRPQNIAKMLPSDWGGGWPNVWLGTTAEDQKHYDRRWPALNSIPAVVRFISYEPAIGPLAFWGQPHWIICGGESGPGARDMDPEWARDLLQQTNVSQTAFFMKQMARKASIPADLMVRQFPEVTR